MAWMAASAELGVGGESEVVVGGEIDDLLAVVVADGRLHVVEDAEMEVGAACLEIIELRGKMLKLWALGERGGHWSLAILKS